MASSRPTGFSADSLQTRMSRPQADTPSPPSSMIRSHRKILFLLLFAALPPFCFGGEDSLRVLAYNIKHGRGMDGKVDIDRIASVIKKQNPDLVALQEVDRHCKRSGGVDIAKALGELLGMEYRFGKAIPLQDGAYGNAVLSRLPIRETRVHPLPRSREPRVALEVQVDFGGRRLSFVSLHLERNSDNRRCAQAEALIDLFSGTSRPVILAGDFNASRNSEAMRSFEPPDWTVLMKNDGNSVRTFQGEKHRKDSESPERMEIDFLVVRHFMFDRVVHGVVPERIASDHRPIYAEFKMKAEPSPE